MFWLNLVIVYRGVSALSLWLIVTRQFATGLVISLAFHPCHSFFELCVMIIAFGMQRMVYCWQLKVYYLEIQSLQVSFVLGIFSVFRQFAHVQGDPALPYSIILYFVLYFKSLTMKYVFLVAGYNATISAPHMVSFL